MKTSLRVQVFTRPRSLGGGDLLVLSLSYSYYIIIIIRGIYYIYIYMCVYGQREWREPRVSAKHD